MKKKYIIVLIISIVVITLIAGVIMLLGHKKNIDNIDYYQAVMKDNIIIKYLSENDIIKVVFDENEYNVYFNDENVGKTKSTITNNSIIEEYYEPGVESYRYKRITYKKSDGSFDYGELYDYDDILLSTYYYENNQVVKIVYNNSFTTKEYKKEEGKLYKYVYKKDLLYSKCNYDDKNIYITFCEYYDKNKNITSIYEMTYTKYGFEKKRMIKDVTNNTTKTYEYEIKNGKVNITNEEQTVKLISSIKNFLFYGSKVLYNTPYIYNGISYQMEEDIDNNSIFYYDVTKNQNVEVYLDDEGYTTEMWFESDNGILGVTLIEGVKIKSYSDAVDYNNFNDNFYNFSDYTYINYEYVKDEHVKSIYKDGTIKYYDWFDGDEITEEEYNLMMNELQD